MGLRVADAGSPVRRQRRRRPRLHGARHGVPQRRPPPGDDGRPDPVPRGAAQGERPRPAARAARARRVARRVPPRGDRARVQPHRRRTSARRSSRSTPAPSARPASSARSSRRRRVVRRRVRLWDAVKVLAETPSHVRAEAVEAGEARLHVTLTRTSSAPSVPTQPQEVSDGQAAPAQHLVHPPLPAHGSSQRVAARGPRRGAGQDRRRAARSRHDHRDRRRLGDEPRDRVLRLARRRVR